MPESPEVQVLAETLDARLSGHTIVGADLAEFRAQKTRDRGLADLEGATVSGVTRRGKHLDIAAGDEHLIVSLGRAGWAMLAEPGGDADPGAPVIATLLLDDGAALSFLDLADWLSLSVSVVREPEDVLSVSKLGPDPLDPGFTRDVFASRLGRRKQVKALLQEQASFAGIGNAYSDEILHVARISPVAHASALTDDERSRLFDAVVGVLVGALADRRGESIGALKAEKVAAMRVHGRAGLPCPVCGETVLDIPGSKGGAQYCPLCQNDGTPL